MNKFNDVITFFGNVTETAKALDVTVQAVCFWRDGLRKLSPEKCSAIEVATNGAITRKDLRPDDWQEIWLELANKKAS